MKIKLGAPPPKKLYKVGEHADDHLRQWHMNAIYEVLEPHPLKVRNIKTNAMYDNLALKFEDLVLVKDGTN